MKSLRTLEGDWLKHREALPVFDSVGEDGATPAYLASTAAIADEILARSEADGRLTKALARMPKNSRRFCDGASASMAMPTKPTSRSDRLCTCRASVSASSS